MSKSPSLRRIQADIRELAKDPSDRYHAAPLESDMFEWHFTIRGADATDFEGGVYHGRIMLPPEYPFKPPHILFLTASGRFETNTKVCLSFSAYHPELWQPAWGIRLILEALISFLPTPADGAIGALDWTSVERKRLAKRSVDYYCPVCGCKPIELLPIIKPKSEAEESKPKSKFQKEIEKLQQLQNAQHGETKDGEKEEDKKEETETTKDEKAPLLKEEAKDNSTSAPQPETPASPEPIVQPAAPAAPVVENQQEPQQASQYQQNTPPAQTVQEEVYAAPQPVPQGGVPEEDGMFSWMVDPVLHGIIVVLAVLCFLMLRKLQAMMEELDSLNEVVEGLGSFNEVLEN